MIDIRKTIAKILAWISAQYIVLSSETSFTVNAGANKPGSLSDWGINIPSGYQAIAISPVLAGSYSTTDSYWCIYGVGGMFNEYGVLVKNTGAQQRNWKLKLVVLCEKVGGVLLSSIFKAFGHLQRIGGGISVKHKSCLAAYTDLDIRALRWCKLAIYKLWHTDYSNTIKERMACSLLDSAKRSNLRASTEDPDRHRDNSGRHRLDAKWKLHSLLLLCKKRSDIQYCSIPLIDNICETILIDPYERWWLYA